MKLISLIFSIIVSYTYCLGTVLRKPRCKLKRCWNGQGSKSPPYYS